MLAPEADLRIASDRSAPRLYCLLLCDLADSTALIERLGDARAADLIRQHDRVARDTLQRHHGREIDKTDGFLILFERPIEAVAFALDYQAELARIGAANGFRLQSRVGIHVGEILSWRNAAADIAGGAKPLEVEGLAKAIAARLMALADPGQILLSESAYSLALRARDELPVEPPVKWKEHGRYRLHGVAAPLPVFAVGVAEAPLLAPRDKIKARRLLPWYRWKPLHALLLLALVAAPLWYVLQPAPAIAFVERDWIVVGDLRNLSDDPRLDAPLDYALRLGMEQSRYVNVVSRARMRETLGHMGVDAGSVVDRERGSELALRVGARAVLLPTVHQSGGRLRFTAELVDPRTGATVHSHFRDALEGDQLLPAMEQVLREVRDDLGESLSAIDASGPPLPQVTSPKLEAVRALVSAIEAKREQRYDASAALADEALRLDPEFAMAYLLRATLHMIGKRYADADADLERAAARRDRLSQRERLFIEATLAAHGSTARMLGAWQAFADLYPDDPRARYNLALFAVEYGNDCGPALHNLPAGPQETVAEKGLRLYEIARCHLMQGDYREARRVFDEANASGLIGNGPEFAWLNAVEGDLDAAAAVLARRHAQRPQAEREAAELVALSLALLRGDPAAIAERGRALQSLAAGWPPSGRSLAAAVRVQLDAYFAVDGWEAAAAEDLRRLLAEAEGAHRQQARNTLDHAGAIAWTLARHADVPPAALIAAWSAAAAAMQARPLADVAGAVEAELLLRRDAPGQARQRLGTELADSAPFIVHTTAARVALGHGDPQAALAGCRRLQAQIGRAGAERALNGALQPSNLIELARLAAALAERGVDGCPLRPGQRELLRAAAPP
jgi:putative peptide modification system cyclase